jgi:hypothetical protein
MRIQRTLSTLKTLWAGANEAVSDTERNTCVTSYVTADNSQPMAYLIKKLYVNERIKTDLSKIMPILFPK